MEIIKEIVRGKNNANKAWTYNLWGVMLEDQKNYDEAINKCNLALNKDPQFLGAYYNPGVVYSDEGDYGKAKESYEKAIELDPTNSRAQNNLDRILNKLKDEEKID